jgi:hypothetical protein
MLPSMEGNMHHLNEGPFVLDAESSFVLSTSSTFHLSPWEIRPGPGKKGLNPIHITTQNGMDLPSILIF